MSLCRKPGRLTWREVRISTVLEFLAVVNAYECRINVSLT